MPSDTFTFSSDKKVAGGFYSQYTAKLNVTSEPKQLTINKPKIKIK